MMKSDEEGGEGYMSDQDFADVMLGLRGAGEIIAGTADRSTYRMHTPLTIELRRLRRAQGRSRPEFAAQYGLDPDALQAWEEGRVDLDTTQQSLVRLILDDPERARAVLARTPVAAAE